MFRRLFPTKEHGDSNEVTIDQVLDYRNSRTVQIVDVRERDKWERGHIPESVHIPLGELPHRHSELNENHSIVTVCQSGRRSLNAVRILDSAGIPGAASLAGGIQAWRSANQPIER